MKIIHHKGNRFEGSRGGWRRPVDSTGDDRSLNLVALGTGNRGGKNSAGSKYTADVQEKGRGRCEGCLLGSVLPRREGKGKGQEYIC